MDFLFLFKLKIIPNCRSRCVCIRFLERMDSYRIRLVSLSESERFNPLRNESDAEKNLFQWKQKVYPIWKLERSDNDPVWWKHSIDLFFKVACRVKTNVLAPWTTKNTTSSHYFSKKLKPILCRVIKGTWKSLNWK